MDQPVFHLQRKLFDDTFGFPLGRKCKAFFKNKGRTPYVEVYLYIRPLVSLSNFNVLSEPKTL